MATSVKIGDIVILTSNAFSSKTTYICRITPNKIFLSDNPNDHIENYKIEYIDGQWQYITRGLIYDWGFTYTVSFKNQASGQSVATATLAYSLYNLPYLVWECFLQKLTDSELKTFCDAFPTRIEESFWKDRLLLRYGQEVLNTKPNDLPYSKFYFLDELQFLSMAYENRIVDKPVDQKMIDAAAYLGLHRVLIFFSWEDNSVKVIHPSIYGLTNAMQRGYFDIVKWILQQKFHGKIIYNPHDDRITTETSYFGGLFTTRTSQPAPVISSAHESVLQVDKSMGVVAIIGGNLELLQWMKELGQFDPTPQDIRWAYLCGHLDVCQWLYENYQKPNNIELNDQCIDIVLVANDNVKYRDNICENPERWSKILEWIGKLGFEVNPTAPRAYSVYQIMERIKVLNIARYPTRARELYLHGQPIRYSPAYPDFLYD